MRIVLGIHTLTGAGGTESYMVTVGDHLQRTGHDVYIYSAEDGHTGDVARSFGLRVAIGTEELPGDVDAILAQDGVAALELLESHPGATLIYNWHSELFDLQLPPQIDGVAKLIVTLHANADRRVRSLAVKTPVLRLTQPIDVMRFAPRSDLHPRPRSLIALGNYLDGERRQTLEAACKIAGIDFRQVGVHGSGITDRPEIALNQADIVVGKARVVLEGMSCGRAVYVYDAFGVDGWVTPESYGPMAATCFAGGVQRRQLDVETLARELLAYEPRMGAANRDLVLANHNAVQHVGLLVEAIEGVLERGAVPAPNDNAFELARLARVNWRHESQAFALGFHLRDMTALKDKTEHELESVRAELAARRERADNADRTVRAPAGSTRRRALNRLIGWMDRSRGRK